MHTIITGTGTGAALLAGGAWLYANWRSRLAAAASTPAPVNPPDAGPFRTPGTPTPPAHSYTRGCGATNGISICGNNKMRCTECLSGPVDTNDFRAEVANGWIHIAVKIPTVACAACGVVYTPKILPVEIEQVHRNGQAIRHAIHDSPWCGQGWKIINDATDYSKRALVCAACAAPVIAAEKAGAELLAKQTATVAAHVTSWK